MSRAPQAENALRHGHNRKGKRTKEYRAWCHIRGRCQNPSDAGYKWYGAKGISVAPEWEVFETFLADMGKAPSPRHSIDRIDSNGDYCPSNCRWATPAQQAKNTCRVILVDGLCLKDACALRGVSYQAAQMRLRRGASIEHALSPLMGHDYRRLIAASPTGGE